MKVKVRSVKDGFRRAGMAFGKAPKEVEVDEKTLKILKDEPMLVVEVLPDQPAKPDEEKKTGKGK